MRNLFNFLYRIRILLLFLALESIAFIWINSSRSYQRSVFMSSANQFTGGLLQRRSEITTFFQLDEQNERLARENARLRSLTRNVYLPVYTGSKQVTDTTYITRYRFQEAEVISGSYHKARNYMTINRGEIHGIKSGMGVIGPEGVVGVINDVSRHFATVIPLINPSFSVSGKIKNSGFFGPVQWNNTDYRFAYLTDIPRYASLTPGDSVVTDARSRSFPAGIQIGYIEAYELQEDQNFYRVKLRLATDFASLNHVQVVEDKMKAEVLELQEQQVN